jgi:hypothetical protein
MKALVLRWEAARSRQGRRPSSTAFTAKPAQQTSAVNFRASNLNGATHQSSPYLAPKRQLLLAHSDEIMPWIADARAAC